MTQKRKPKKNKDGRIVGRKHIRASIPRIPPAAREARVWVDALSEVESRKIFTAERNPSGLGHTGTATVRIAHEDKEAIDHGLRWMADYLFPTARINGRIMNPITLEAALAQESGEHGARENLDYAIRALVVIREARTMGDVQDLVRVLLEEISDG